MKRRAGRMLTALTAAAATTISCMGRPEVLDVNFQRTNEQGIAYLDQPVLVRNEVRNMAGALVYQVEGFNHSYLTLGIELNERPLPERHELGSGLLESGAQQSGLMTQESGSTTPESGMHQSALIPEIVLVLQTARAFNYARKDAQKQRRQFLGDTRNVNKYCVTLDQMAESYIRVPMGIIGLASEEIKVRTSAPLEKLFEKYVVKTFGRQKGYEVWVPKTAINLCGEEFQGIICPIDRETLSEKLWMHANVPVWEIKGPCDPYRVRQR